MIITRPSWTLCGVWSTIWLKCVGLFVELNVNFWHGYFTIWLARFGGISIAYQHPHWGGRIGRATGYKILGPEDGIMEAQDFPVISQAIYFVPLLSNGQVNH